MNEWEVLKEEAFTQMRPDSRASLLVALARFEVLMGQCPTRAQLIKWTAKDVQNVVNRCTKAGHGASSVALTVTALRRMFQPLMREELVITFPGLGVKMPRLNKRAAEHNVVPPEQLQALLDAPVRSGLGLRDYAVLLTLVRMGLRASELAGLRMNQLVKRPDGRTVVTFVGKGEKKAKMGVREEVLEAAAAWRAYVRSEQPKKYRWVLDTPECPFIPGYVRARVGLAGSTSLFVYLEPLTRHGISKLVQRYTDALGLKDVTAHGLRATAISGWIAKHGVAAAMKLARHSKVELTMRYDRWEVLFEEDAVKQRGEDPTIRSPRSTP